MLDDSNLVLCYNKGCGVTFNPQENTEDSCYHHPGDPVFHDAYKGWSCCTKKCTDFTEFLNIKGCTKSLHSSVKPPEPVRPVVDKSKADEVIQYKAPTPVNAHKSNRPLFDSELVAMNPEITSSLKSQFEALVIHKGATVKDTGAIEVGTACKNGGCKVVFETADTSYPPCIHHPGYPVFHEGLKFWTCCKKRTTDFSAFLEQVGCTTSDDHLWVKPPGGGDTAISSRYDWHQTGGFVVVAIYAKKYDPYKSTVRLNAIRAKVHIEFPQDENTFDVDWELWGVINVDQCQVSMTPTKIELKLKKADPESWNKLEWQPKKQTPVLERPVPPPETNDDTNDDPVDLSDIY